MVWAHTHKLLCPWLLYYEMFHRTHTNEPALIQSHDSHKKEISFLGKQAIQRISRCIKKLTKLNYRTKTYFFMDKPTHLDGLAKPEGHRPPLEMISTHIHTFCRCVYTCEPHMDAGRPVDARHLWLFKAKQLNCPTSRQQAHEREFSDSTSTPTPPRVCVMCVCHMCVSYPSITMLFLSWSSNQVNGPRERKARSVTLSRETSLI